MRLENYISDIIKNHQNKFCIYFSLYARDTIKREINKGVYAFQLIYDDEYQVRKIINLDHNLCIHENNLGVYGVMWSYDGGQRYQWTEWETLVFDPSVIRNIKLEELLNDSN
jgi:hypothetical protein